MSCNDEAQPAFLEGALKYKRHRSSSPTIIPKMFRDDSSDEDGSYSKAEIRIGNKYQATVPSVESLKINYEKYTPLFDDRARIWSCAISEDVMNVDQYITEACICLLEKIRAVRLHFIINNSRCDASINSSMSKSSLAAGASAGGSLSDSSSLGFSSSLSPFCGIDTASNYVVMSKEDVLETAMSILHTCDYDVGEAWLTIQETDPHRLVTVWTPEEQISINEAVGAFGGDIRLLAAAVQSKSLREVKDYFFMFVDNCTASMQIDYSPFA